MSDEKEKRMVESYEITQGIRIGDKEVVFGVDERQKCPTSALFIPAMAFLNPIRSAWWAMITPRLWSCLPTG